MSNGRQWFLRWLTAFAAMVAGTLALHAILGLGLGPESLAMILAVLAVVALLDTAGAN